MPARSPGFVARSWRGRTSEIEHLDRQHRSRRLWPIFHYPCGHGIVLAAQPVCAGVGHRIRSGCGRVRVARMRQPGVRQSEWFWALCEHVVGGTQFDNMRRMARARRGGSRPTIRGLGVRRGGRVRWRCARPSRAACGMPMRSPMRCSVPNRVCSEVLSFRVSLGGGSVFVVVAGESEGWGLRGRCRARRDGG